MTVDPAELERRYFEEVESYPVLSDAQVQELRSTIRLGDTDSAEVAATDLVCSHLRQVVAVVRDIERSSVLLDVDGKPLSTLDLCFAGTLGLMQAVQNDDGSEPFADRADRMIRKAIAEGSQS